MNYKLVDFYKIVVAVLAPHPISISYGILHQDLFVACCISFFGTILIRVFLDLIEPKLERFLK